MAHDKNNGSALTVRNIVAAVIGVVLLIFILQNRDEAKLTLLFWHVTTGLWLLLAATVVLAFIVGLLFGRSVVRSSAKKA